MKILIAENSYIARVLMYELLSEYGECDFVTDGLEAVNAYMASLKARKPYDLISLNPKLPFVDGNRVLKAIRLIEKALEIGCEDQVKVMFTTKPENFDLTPQLIHYEPNAFLLKSTDTLQLVETLREQGLIQETA